MLSVAFLRAVNVGGRTLRARALADELGLLNVGAAGTFVGAMSPRVLEQAIAQRLPFATQIMACPGAEIRALAASAPFGAARLAADTRGHLTILERAPTTMPRLPFERPAGKPWELRVVAIDGRYVLSLRRRLAPRTLYPNPIIERELGLAATTRTWDTLLEVARLVAAG